MTVLLSLVCVCVHTNACTPYKCSQSLTYLQRQIVSGTMEHVQLWDNGACGTMEHVQLSSRAQRCGYIQQTVNNFLFIFANIVFCLVEWNWTTLLELWEMCWLICWLIFGIHHCILHFLLSVFCYGELNVHLQNLI